MRKLLAQRIFACTVSWTCFIVICAYSRPADSAEPGRIVVEPQPGANPWTDLPFRNEPNDFQFAIVTDRTGGHRPGVFPEGVFKAGLLQPEFVMTVGDLIEGYSEDESELDKQWDEIESFVSVLNMPFFYLPGNHDITNPVMARKWDERFGRSYYHFIYRDVLFLCLNTEDTKASTISDEQVAYFREVLAANTDVRWTLVFMHKPLWVYDEPSGWQQIEELIAGRDYTVFAGHFHSYTKYVRHDQRYFILATTGGWSRLRGSGFGEFDHVVWVTMTDDGPIIANLQLDGILDEDVVTEQDRVRVGELTNKLQAVKVASISMEDVAFNHGTTSVRLTNDADIPLHISARIDPPPELTVEPDGFERIIPPNSVEFVEVEIQAVETVSSGQILSVRLAYSTRYDEEGRPPLELKDQTTFVIGKQRPFDSVRRSTPVEVDGHLGEWTEWPFVVRHPFQVRYDYDKWRGPEDSWFRFAVEYDEEFLYVAVEVFDDAIVVGPVDDPPWEHDAIEVYLDARPDSVSSIGRGEGEFTEHVKVSVSPGKGADGMLLFEQALLPADLKVAAAVTATGHGAEVAIPVSYLNERQQKPWKVVRLNVAITDQDADGGPVAQLLWRPKWQTPESYSGSGTLVRPR